MKAIQVAIVGAGPAGLGCAALLKQMGINNDDITVFEAGRIGSSFEAWPTAMRMITPSFPSNGYHQTDLNAITPDTSPGFSLGKEHPSGEEYAGYLRSVVEHYEIPVQEHTAIVTVSDDGDDGFVLETVSAGTVKAQYLIWAAGEYSSPKLNAFQGGELCLHNSQIDAWSDCKDDHYAVIGCYESGVDAAYNLANLGKGVTLVDTGQQQPETYDPSRVLSPYTSERLQRLADNDQVTIEQGFRVQLVRKTASGYDLISSDGKILHSQGRPINCTGFDTHLGPVRELFDVSEQGHPILNTYDESTLKRNLFFCGPKMVHGNILLCFIYKFRGRFGKACSIIGSELELDTEILNHYQQAGMLLDDLSCCEEQQCHC